MIKNCLICERIDLIKQEKNPYFVKELKSGYVVMGDYQFYKGYTLLLSKTHTDELHKLDEIQRIQFLRDMAIVAEAVYKTFNPRKLNYELLGNTDSHLHWHLFPRYENDLKPDVPIWVIDRNVRCAESTKPTEQQLNVLKTQLLKNLELIKSTNS